jgi:hypothetical protein
MVLVLFWMNGMLIWLYTYLVDRLICLNVVITDGKALYTVINVLYGGGSPTTFAHITLIHSTFRVCSS